MLGVDCGGDVGVVSCFQPFGVVVGGLVGIVVLVVGIVVGIVDIVVVVLDIVVALHSRHIEFGAVYYFVVHILLVVLLGVATVAVLDQGHHPSHHPTSPYGALLLKISST